MPWPDLLAYNDAIQHPRVCFSDPDLAQSVATVDRLGLPRPATGSFAAVYKLSALAQKHWAVKCFTREAKGLQQRYRAISDHFRRTNLPFFVEFEYLERGILISGQWFPVVKMGWVDGLRINEFVHTCLLNANALQALARMFLQQAQQMRAAHTAHGDLQHGNIFVIPSSQPWSMKSMLVDYDGMFVPELAGSKSSEVGHENYQHPKRLHNGYYGVEMDRFSYLVIYTALRCLLVDPTLWDMYNNDENLLFRGADFTFPGSSALFRHLWGLRDYAARSLAGHLLLAATRPVDQVFLLEQLVTGEQVRGLSNAEEQQVCRLLGVGAPPMKCGVKWWESVQGDMLDIIQAPLPVTDDQVQQPELPCAICGHLLPIPNPGTIICPRCGHVVWAQPVPATSPTSFAQPPDIPAMPSHSSRQGKASKRELRDEISAIRKRLQRKRNLLAEWQEYRQECEQQFILLVPIVVSVISLLSSVTLGICVGQNDRAFGLLIGFIIFALTFPVSVLWLTHRRDMGKNELVLCDEQIAKLKTTIRELEDDLQSLYFPQ